METIRLAFNDSLTDDEKSRLTKSAKRVVHLTVSDQTDLDLVLPPISGASHWEPGQQQQLGFDVGSILLIAIGTGGAIFLKKLTEKMAEDFWFALKALIARVGARRKAIPKDSLQLQISLEFEDGILVDAVLTCLHARFVDDEAWLSVIREWRSQLDERLLAVRTRARPAGTIGARKRTRITIHAVVRGAATPDWFIGEPEPRG